MKQSEIYQQQANRFAALAKKARKEEQINKSEIKLGRYGRVIDAAEGTEVYMVFIDGDKWEYVVEPIMWYNVTKSSIVNHFPTREAAEKYRTYMQAIYKLETSYGRKEFFEGEKNWAIDGIMDDLDTVTNHYSAAKTSLLGLYWKTYDQVEQAWNYLTTEEKQAIYDLS